MARIRTIKPEFFKNEELADLCAFSRLLFIGLWTQADRDGRLEDRPKRLKADIFPYDDLDVDKILDGLEKNKFIIRYQAGGMKLIQIRTFLKHQVPHYKEVPSILPPVSEDFKGSVVVTPLTKKEINEIYERDGRECKNCGKTEDLTIDHIHPISLGGTKEPDNLQVLCRSCNSSKNNRVNHDPTLGQSCTQEGKGMDNRKGIGRDSGNGNSPPKKFVLDWNQKKEELRNADVWLEANCMRFGFSKEKLLQELEDFFIHIASQNRTGDSLNELQEYFPNRINSKISKEKSSGKKETITQAQDLEWKQ